MKSRQKIAIVDDSVFARKCVRVALGATYEYIELDSALIVPAALDREAPDLVLMDVNMPGLNGNRLVEVIRRSVHHRCPIVLLSDTPEPKLAELARACGAAGYIQKSSDFSRMKREVERHMTLLAPRKADAPGEGEA
jgi:DNA-binding NarL/FixJ family response regulator